MPRPRALHIGLAKWKVRWTREALEKILGHSPDAGGACHEQTMTIAVDPLPKAPLSEREVLLHEVLHACVAASSASFERDQEEAFIAILAPRLLEALRQNKALVNYLTEPI